MKKRIMVKISGEMLGGSGVFDRDKLQHVVREIQTLSLAHDVVVVVGGGNIVRGRELSGLNIDSAVADHVGMMATMMNGLVLRNSLKEELSRLDPVIRVRLMTAHTYLHAGEPYVQQKAIHFLNEGGVLILSGGTGNPYCTTDFASALRAVELHCDLVLKATQVDGVYDADPKKFTTAKKYDHLSYDDAIAHKLSVMDITAFALCSEHKMPIRVFCGDGPYSFPAAVRGDIGTLVS